MAPTRDDFRDLGWLLRLLNRSSLEARYPRWRGSHTDGSLHDDDDSETERDEKDDPRLVHVSDAAADDAA